MTNNSTKSRKGYLKKFQILGLNVSAVSPLQTAGREGAVDAEPDGSGATLAVWQHCLKSLKALWELTNCCLLVQEEIYSSSYAAAAFLEAEKFPKDKKVRLHSFGKQHSISARPQHPSRCAGAACAPAGVLLRCTAMLVSAHRSLHS